MKKKTDNEIIIQNKNEKYAKSKLIRIQIMYKN